MLKRQSASPSGASNAKNPRTAGDSAPAQGSEPIDIDAAIARAQHASRAALQTLRLQEAIKSLSGSFKERMQTVVDVFKEDADCPHALLDLALVPAEGEPCVLFQLLRFFRDCIPADLESLASKTDKNAAQQLIHGGILPLLPKLLLRSFDPATVDAAKGNNALHELCRLCLMEVEGGRDYKLAGLLIAHGVSVQQPNKEGLTPLLLWGENRWPHFKTANGLRLLVAHGADLNVQDSQGDGVLHHLVRNKAHQILTDLCGQIQVGRLDCHLINGAGQTPADLASIHLTQQAVAEDSPEKRTHRLMRLQSSTWSLHVRPVLQLCLEQVLPVADLAKLVLGYVDGSGPPLAAAAPDDAQLSDEAASAAEAVTSADAAAQS